MKGFDRSRQLYRLDDLPFDCRVALCEFWDDKAPSDDEIAELRAGGGSSGREPPIVGLAKNREGGIE
jgi:hypothetical protein